MRVYCLDCGSSARPVKHTPGSFLLELFLWCLFLVPGLVYSLWRLSARGSVCRVCDSRRIVPSDSPRARRAAEQRQNAVEEIMAREILGRDRTFSKIFSAALILLYLLLTLSTPASALLGAGVVPADEPRTVDPTDLDGIAREIDAVARPEPGAARPARGLPRGLPLRRPIRGRPAGEPLRG
jgi:hypothetical protein